MSKAIICTGFGGVDSLVFGELDDPQPDKDEVLIRVSFAGVNYPDTLIIEGKYQFRPDFPFAPGQEVSGEVIEVGREVDHVAVGDVVIASMTWGGYAEVVKAHKHNVYLLPPEIDMEKGAAVLETFGTVMHGLKDRGNIKPGETMVVLGASGGIGSAAVQLGQAFGARVLAVCSTKEKQQKALENGAYTAMGYDNLRENLRQYPIDVVFDPVGGEVSEQAFRSLRSGGRHLVVGFASGKIPAIPFNLPLLKNASIVGVFWGSFWRENPTANRNNIRTVLKWMSEGKISVSISQTYQLSEGHLALQAVKDRKAIGKLILQVS